MSGLQPVSRRTALSLTCALAALSVLAFVLLRSGAAAGDGTDSRTADARDEPARSAAIEGLPATSAGGQARRDAIATAPDASAIHGDIAPPDGARVDLVAHETGRTVQQMATGAYRFGGLAEGAYTVSAHRAGAFSRVVTVELDAGEERRVDLRLEPPIELEVIARGEDLPRRDWPRALRVVATPWRPEPGRPIAGLLASRGNRFGLGYIRWDDDSEPADGVRRVGSMNMATTDEFWISFVRHNTPIATVGPLDPDVEHVTLPWSWPAPRTLRVLEGGRGGRDVRLVSVDRELERQVFEGGAAEFEGVLPGEYLLEADGDWGLWSSHLVVEPGPRGGTLEVRVPNGPSHRVSVTCIDAVTGAPLDLTHDGKGLPTASFEIVPADAPLPFELASAYAHPGPFGGATTELRMLPGRFHIRLVSDDLQSGTALVDNRAGDVQVSLPCAPRSRLIVRPPAGLDWTGREFIVRDGKGRVLWEKLLHDAGPVSPRLPTGILHLEARAGARLLATGTVNIEAGGGASRTVALRPR